MRQQQKAEKISKLKTRLELYYKREEEMLSGGVQSYGIGTRNATRYQTDLSAIRKAINEKEATLDARPGSAAPRASNYGYSEAGASWKKKALKSFKASSSSPQWDIDHNNDTLRQRARMLYMAAPVATSAIKTNRTNVIGCGLKLNSRIDAKRLGMSQEAAKE